MYPVIPVALALGQAWGYPRCPFLAAVVLPICWGAELGDGIHRCLHCSNSLIPFLCPEPICHHHCASAFCCLQPPSVGSVSSQLFQLFFGISGWLHSLDFNFTQVTLINQVLNNFSTNVFSLSFHISSVTFHKGKLGMAAAR